MTHSFPAPTVRGPTGTVTVAWLGVAALVLASAVSGCRLKPLEWDAAAVAARPASREGLPTPSAQRLAAPLRVLGRFFTDAAGRIVILRGVNVSVEAKVPPFLPAADPSAFDRLVPLGMNVVRLVFIWEAYEPAPGQYDESYLARLRALAEGAWARGLYVIIDIHQDGFARCLCRGCGAGFPSWAISPRAEPAPPDNGPRCQNWVYLLVTDPSVHRSLTDFYADTHGVRTRYLAMLGRVAATFASSPGVIGYDLLNEPWGDERRELAPLYRDAAAAVRARHPTALLFLAGHAATGAGFQSRLPRPEFDNCAYAPHYYKPFAILCNGWRGSTASIDLAFRHMEAKAADWGVPLFVGEFGIPADAARAGDYVGYLYDRLDDALASGAQWNDSPGWNPREKDGWNGEDYSILDPSGSPRPNYRLRPFPRKVAGVPFEFQFHPPDPPARGASLSFTWEHRPETGETEIFVPNALFPRSSTLTVQSPDVFCVRDESRQVLLCRVARTVTVRVTLQAP
jgi:endoglycosylceramidase